MPKTAKWSYIPIKIKDDKLDRDGQRQMENIELYLRDPVECIKQLLSNPVFKDQMRYTPEKVYMDEGRKERVYDECWTGDWWWETQVSKSGGSKN